MQLPFLTSQSLSKSRIGVTLALLALLASLASPVSASEDGQTPSDLASIEAILLSTEANLPDIDSSQGFAQLPARVVLEDSLAIADTVLEGEELEVFLDAGRRLLDSENSTLDSSYVRIPTIYLAAGNPFTGIAKVVGGAATIIGAGVAAVGACVVGGVPTVGAACVGAGVGFVGAAVGGTVLIADGVDDFADTDTTDVTNAATRGTASSNAPVCDNVQCVVSGAAQGTNATVNSVFACVRRSGDTSGRLGQTQSATFCEPIGFTQAAAGTPVSWSGSVATVTGGIFGGAYRCTAIAESWAFVEFTQPGVGTYVVESTHSVASAAVSGDPTCAPTPAIP